VSFFEGIEFGVREGDVYGAAFFGAADFGERFGGEVGGCGRF
jgi:hypothetical protein